MPRRLLSPDIWSVDVAALVLRVVFCGLMVYYHAFMKWTLFRENPDSFPDPLGLGGTATFYLVIFAEGVCGALVLLGLFTRLALIPLLVSMAVALFNIHWENSLPQQELTLLYLGVYAALFWLGPGYWSLDHKLFGKKWVF
jgi:putative oxidoreductase